MTIILIMLLNIEQYSVVQRVDADMWLSVYIVKIYICNNLNNILIFSTDVSWWFSDILYLCIQFDFNSFEICANTSFSLTFSWILLFCKVSPSIMAWASLWQTVVEATEHKTVSNPSSGVYSRMKMLIKGWSPRRSPRALPQWGIGKPARWEWETGIHRTWVDDLNKK